MRRYFLLSCLLASSTMFASPRAAHADDAAVKEAQARFDEGVALADAGKNEEARLKFTQAAAVLKAPSVLFNLARVEQLTGHELEALDHYKQFLRAAENDPKVTDALRDKTRAYIADLSKKAGQIELDAPPETRVTVDGKPVDRNPADPLHVTPGRHTLEGAYQGRVKSVVVDCPAGVVTKAKLDFDGPVTEPPPGGETTKAWSTGKVVTVGALAAGAVAGGVLFVVFRSQAQGNVDDAKAALNGSGCVGVTSPACDQAASLKEDRDTNQAVSTVALVGGVALAAGALGAVFLWPNQAKERAARATPLVGPGFAGMSVGGRF